MQNLIFLNGKFVKESDAKISVLDRGFLYGDGVFETMRAYGGRVFRFNEHIERLFYALKVTKIKHNFTKDYFKLLINEILLINRLSDAYIRLTITRGLTDNGISIKLAKKPTVFLMAKKLKIDDRLYLKGVNLKIIPAKRADSEIYSIKSLNYLENILLKEKARLEGFDDALILDTSGRITECTTSNIFFVIKNKLITPALNLGILPGITREVIIDMADLVGIKCSEKPFSKKDIGSIEEAFITNSILEIVPVVKIGRVLINKGRIGKVTKNLHLAYKRLVDLEVSKFS